MRQLVLVSEAKVLNKMRIPRLARAGPRSEPTIYEVVRIDGCFRRADSAPRGKPQTGPTGLQLIRRARGRDDNIPLHSVSGNDIVSSSADDDAMLTLS